jgi:enoyl-CoA hydratase/carnithine racemase
LDWILRGLHIDALTAKRNGLCTDIVAGELLLPRALELALELRKRGPKAVAQSKRSIYLSEDVDLRSARHFGLEALAMLVGSAEWNEGMRAFCEGRAAEFDTW